MSRRGSATRVGEQGAAPAEPATPAADPARPPRFDLRPGTPDVSLFPRRTWASALAAVLRDAPDDRFGYPMPQGALELRTELAAYLGRVRGVVADPDAIVITSGVAQGLSLVTRVLRARGETRIGLEDPGTGPIRAQLDRRRAGARADPGRRRRPRRRRARAQRRARGVRHARAPVPHRRRAQPGAARATARVGRARDRGRLRRRVPLRPRTGRRACKGSRPTGSCTSAHSARRRRPRCGRAGWSRRRASPTRSCARRPTTTTAHPCSSSSRSPGCSPAARSTATSGAPGSSTCGVATRCSPRSRDSCPRHARTGSRRACTSCSNCPATSTTSAVAEAAARRDIAVVPLTQHRVAPRGPALILGYGQLAEPAIEAAVSALAAAIRSVQ